jgi:hypothetical protein
MVSWRSANSRSGADLEGGSPQHRKMISRGESPICWRQTAKTIPVPLMVLVIALAAVITPLTQASSGALGNVALANSAVTWGLQHDGFDTQGISCPSSTVCFASGNMSEGGALASMSGTTWSSPSLVGTGPTLTDSLGQISCPSTSTCFAIGMSAGSGSVPIVEETINSGCLLVAVSHS